MTEISRHAEASLFGTDGIRDRAGEGLLTDAHVERLVSATAHVLASGTELLECPPPDARTILVARDTRQSGRALFNILAEKFGGYGYVVKDLGVLPTPAVSYLATQWGSVALGVVLSASHNPADYNGIKFFSRTGEKVSDEFETALSTAFWTHRAPPETGDFSEPESVATEAFETYLKYLVGCCRRPERLQGRSVVLDTANGATFRIAPAVFRSLGMNVVTLGNEPDGMNINEACGALHPDKLADFVRGEKHTVGFCFDGDGDRMIPVGRSGSVFDGDHVLYLAARHLHAANRLPHKVVVATVMSNFGLEKALSKHGLELLRTSVGDRHVYREMLEGGHVLGGEQSGHTIFLDDAKTGDGILSAIRLLDALETDDLDLESEAGKLQRFPQVLKNVRVKQKLPFEDFPAVQETVDAAKGVLAGAGRIVLRYSGTEPLARVMIEGPDEAVTEELTDRICDAIRTHMA